jgi:hypothetical protein
MTAAVSRSRMTLLAAALTAVVSGGAFAQTAVATRAGNIWNGRDHEPVPSEVTRKEQATGIAPSAPRQQATTDEVETLYENLMRSEGVRPR